MNVLRDSVVIGTTADDGQVNDNLGTQTGTFTYRSVKRTRATARMKSRSKSRNRNS